MHLVSLALCIRAQNVVQLRSCTTFWDAPV